MWEEDTDDVIRCPHCGESDSCQHLLAVLDRTFGDCTGGYAYERYAELEDQVEAAFARELEADDAEETDWDTDDLRELWESSRESYDPKSGHLSVDATVLVRVVADLFSQGGGDEFAGAAAEGDAQYPSSSLAVFHAEDPKAVFDTAVEALTVLLRQE